MSSGHYHNPYLAYNPSGKRWKSSTVTATSASSSYYTSDDLCGEPAKSIGYRDPGYIHHAEIHGYAPNELVDYVVGDDAHETAVFTVKMPPGPGERVTIAVFGDMGHAIEDDAHSWQSYGSPSKHVMAQLISDLDEYDAVFHIGDISYATGYNSVWDEFLDQIEPIASKRPYLITLGNHEQDVPMSKFLPGYATTIYTRNDSGGECGVPALKNFKTPRASDREPWYSIDLVRRNECPSSCRHNRALLVLMAVSKSLSLRIRFVDSSFRRLSCVHSITADLLRTTALVTNNDHDDTLTIVAGPYSRACREH